MDQDTKCSAHPLHIDTEAQRSEERRRQLVACRTQTVYLEATIGELNQYVVRILDSRAMWVAFAIYGWASAAIMWWCV